MSNTNTIGVSRESLELVEQALTMFPKGLNVSEISRACDDLSRHTVYRALELLGAQKDSTYYPATYTLPEHDKVRDRLIHFFEYAPDEDYRTAEQLADAILEIVR